MMLAWHFVDRYLRDGRPIPANGETLRHEGELEITKSGFHAYERLTDALRYSPGPTICRVWLGGDILTDTDKFCAYERTILWRVDGERILRDFARLCVRDIPHLWEGPQAMQDYLETSSKGIRNASWSVARIIAWNATQNTNRSVAWAAQDARLVAMVEAARETRL